MAAMVDPEDWSASLQFYNRLIRSGIVRALEEAGIEAGDVVRIGEVEWEMGLGPATLIAGSAPLGGEASTAGRSESQKIAPPAGGGNSVWMGLAGSVRGCRLPAAAPSDAS